MYIFHSQLGPNLSWIPTYDMFVLADNYTNYVFEIETIRTTLSEKL